MTHPIPAAALAQHVGTTCAYCGCPIRDGAKFCSDQHRGQWHTAARLLGTGILASGIVSAPDVIRQHEARRRAEIAAGGAYTAEEGHG